MEREQTTTIKTITLPIVEAKSYLQIIKDHLDYLIDLHKRYKVCFTKKEQADKLILEEKIKQVTVRYHKLKSHIYKDITNEENKING